jgi:hypothetical protein
MALPVVMAERQRVMAVSVLTCDRVLADLDGRAPRKSRGQSRLALADVPHAARVGLPVHQRAPPSIKSFRRQAAPTIIRDAVQGIAQGCVSDPDRMGMLVACRSRPSRCARRGSVATGPRSVVGHRLWVSAGQRTETRSGEACYRSRPVID